MIEKDLLDKSKGQGGGRSVNRIMDSQFDKNLEKYVNVEDLRVWHKDDLEDLEKKIKSYR